MMRKIVGFLTNNKLEKRERVEYALDALGLLHASLSSQAVPINELEEFRSNFSILLTNKENTVGLHSYTLKCENYAERGRLDGFSEACGMRSILQLLIDDFINWDYVDSPNLRETLTEDIEDIDGTLEDVSDEAPPIHERDIPEWAPESHWWWRSPKQQNMSKEERESRLGYDFWDGLND